MACAINFNVSGVFYSLQLTDIGRFPDSYFAHLLEVEWNADQTKVVMLDRDGRAFRYIHQFMFAGDFETKNDLNIGLDLMLLIKREADFFNLPELVKLCDQRLKSLVKEWCKTSAQAPTDVTNYCCVGESEQLPNDELVISLAPFRPPCVATTNFTSLLKNRSSFCTDEEVVLSLARNEFPYQRVKKLDENTGLSYKTLEPLQRHFTHWPFGNRCMRITEDYTVYVYTEGSYCTRREHTPDYHKSGSLLYILNSDFTGGAVTCTINGQAVSIDKPGECMALEPGCTYSVGTVTSGVLILVEIGFEFVTHVWCDSKTIGPEWKLYYRCSEVTSRDKIPSYICASLVSSIDTCLCEHNSIVIGLASYHPIRYSEHEHRRFETDPDLLFGMNAVLFNLLSEQFDISVVTVQVTRIDNYQRIYDGRVLDYEPPVKLSATNSETVPALAPICKIVVPVYGHGLRFQHHTNRIPSVRMQGACTEVWDSVLTGLMVTKKKG